MYCFYESVKRFKCRRKCLDVRPCLDLNAYYHSKVLEHPIFIYVLYTYSIFIIYYKFLYTFYIARSPYKNIFKNVDFQTLVFSATGSECCFVYRS